VIELGNTRLRGFKQSRESWETERK